MSTNFRRAFAGWYKIYLGFSWVFVVIVWFTFFCLDYVYRKLVMFVLFLIFVDECENELWLANMSCWKNIGESPSVFFKMFTFYYASVTELFYFIYVNISVVALWMTPDGRLVSSSWDKSIKIWDLTTEKCQRNLVGHSGGGMKINHFYSSITSIRQRHLIIK